MASIRLRRVAASTVFGLALVLAGLWAAPAQSDTVDSLRASAGVLSRAEHRALLDLYAAEAAAARARHDADQLSVKLERANARLASARRHQRVVRASLVASRARVAAALRTLYVDDPEPGVLAVILGASSLDDALDGYESLRYARDQNERLGRDAEQRGRELRTVTVRLAGVAATLRTLRANASSAAARVALIATERAGVLAALRERSKATTVRIRELEQRAMAAQRISERVSRARSAVSNPPPESSFAAGTTSQPLGVVEQVVASPSGSLQLEVSAVAYSLPGRTALGLPVGPGIIAVDPNVIPLGTRVFVPGYGSAIAADTGSAIRGNIIDLWMPTTAAARAWGNRTVTITIYRS